ncbi:hypothetical protein NQX30_01295 [Candidatus Persebacteraceae bacterium Df01]|jgi:uncharacterized membrane protein YgcG|uniref:Uncharacterized protein n=1 Tax=Candidatus Doriopsillibacter californiensis TaxID=2970740 RepID=A0ABT7QK84_9GAMM|nr:hypothetical protein [Candidatus Persebacteraceae bacterium Df01]
MPACLYEHYLHDEGHLFFHDSKIYNYGVVAIISANNREYKIDTGANLENVLLDGFSRLPDDI